MEEKTNTDSIDINEDIRLYRLERIHDSEIKLHKFIEAYDEINEYLVIKFTKNVSLNIIRLVLGLLILFLIISSFFFFFPGRLINIIENSGTVLSRDDIDMIYLIGSYIAYLFLILAGVLFYIGFLLKKNIRSRNSIFKLNRLLEEVIDYMEVATSEEKRKYEFYVDYLEEIKNRKTQKPQNQ